MVLETKIRERRSSLELDEQVSCLKHQANFDVRSAVKVQRKVGAVRPLKAVSCLRSVGRRSKQNAGRAAVSAFQGSGWVGVNDMGVTW